MVLRGTVKDALPATRTVTICRKVAGRLTVLKKVKISSSGAFRWTIKARRVGKWVLVACYKPAGGSYTSRPVTLTVHR